MENKPTWQLAEQICEVPAVDEAIRTFVEDNTGDNAIGVVLAVLEHQAATEAAKATGTAGEIDADAEMAKVKRDVELMGVGFLVDGKRCSLDRITWFNRPGDTWLPPPQGYPADSVNLEAKRMLDTACMYQDLYSKAEESRLSLLAAPAVAHLKDLPAHKLYDICCRQAHAVKEADKCIARYQAELMAARQPAPALPVKPWEARMQEYFAQGSVKMRTPASFMADEIIDWRAALAATAAPVLSNISAGLSIPDAKDFDPVGLNPYVVQEADAIPKISLSDDQLDKIARSYFAEEWAQNHLKNAIHDAFITARSQP